MAHTTRGERLNTKASQEAYVYSRVHAFMTHKVHIHMPGRSFLHGRTADTRPVILAAIESMAVDSIAKCWRVYRAKVCRQQTVPRETARLKAQQHKASHPAAGQSAYTGKVDGRPSQEPCPAATRSERWQPHVLREQALIKRDRLRRVRMMRGENHAIRGKAPETP